MGFNPFSGSEVCFSQIPLPKGEGGPKGRVRGKVLDSSPLTRRPSGDGRHPLPSGEGFVPNNFLIWTVVRGINSFTSDCASVRHLR